MQARLVVFAMLAAFAGGAAGVMISQAWLGRRLEAAIERALRERERDGDLALGRAAIVSVAAGAGSAGERASELRALRDELAQVAERLSAAAARAGDHAQAVAPKTPPSPEQEAAHQSAMRALSDAIARGEWTQDDFERFDRAMQGAPTEHQQALATALSKAINEGRFRKTYLPGVER